MRDIDIGETGSYGISDNDVNMQGVWSNEETGRQSFGGTGGITVGADVMTVALGDANEAAGGLKTTDMGIEGQVSRRESRRAPRGFDDPEMDRESYTLAVEERIKGEAEADKRSTHLAERFERVREQAAAKGEVIADRAERCRVEVMADTHYARTTSEEAPEVETKPDPWGELEQSEVAAVNKSAQRLAEHFGHETYMGRASIARCLAVRLAEGQHITNATIGLKESIEQFPDVKQPIASIDPFHQYQTTIEATVDVLWSPRGTGQRQVGLLSDDNDDTVKVVIWQKSGRKPTLKEGDRVRIERGKVNAYQRNGEWETSIAVDAEAEIRHLEHGDGPGTRRKMSGEPPSPPAWSMEAKSHQWLMEMDADGSKAGEHKISSERIEATNDWLMGRISDEEFDAGREE
ncbi:hypothetical protein [Halorubrum sp. AJ67]|uniref:hypothetical protein n=1 Tax=Halorubrum sp. AJ67 TaxID=1173487 RepID=UPI0003DBFC5C|nr:hypothetical protein [Halorubrum sp. AJ67]CDK38226.1 OB-fold nucleic acid binding domain protein [Halorubrum sp. AJ67]